MRYSHSRNFCFAKFAVIIIVKPKITVGQTVLRINKMESQYFRPIFLSLRCPTKKMPTELTVGI
jgi:hypothetical protein